MEYEETTINHNNNCTPTQLLKTKDVIEMYYPSITLYSLNKALKEEKIPVVKIGNLNYFRQEDIENFLTSKTWGKYK